MKRGDKVRIVSHATQHPLYRRQIEFVETAFFFGGLAVVKDLETGGVTMVSPMLLEPASCPDCGGVDAIPGIRPAEYCVCGMNPAGTYGEER